jgi:hypothetical protein
MLDGVSQVAIAAFLAEGYIGRLATLYLVHLDSSGNVIADPLILFLGYMNTAWNVDEHVDPDGGWARVSTSIVSPLARFNQKRGIRADLVSHQRHYSTDTFMSHIAAIPDGDIGWGIYRAC